MFDKNLLNSKTDKYLRLLESIKVSDIHTTNIKEFYFDLIEIINYHNHNYYIDADPLISDYQYDKIFEFLKNIEFENPNIISTDSPTQWLTYQIQTWFKQAEHVIPILSLDNSYSSEDIKDWGDFLSRSLEKQGCTIKPHFILEPKFDWSSVELVYKRGKFIQAITRWDWYIWEDITENVKTVRGVPRSLNWADNISEIRLRWEILMPRTQLDKINQERQAKWEQVFANTRNATAWTLRQLDPNIVAQRWLVCYVFEILNIEQLDLWYNSYYDQILILIDKWGFYPYKDLVYYTNDPKWDYISEIVDECNRLKQLLISWWNYKNLDLDFDGCVIKIDEIAIRKILWTTSHHPRRAMAYKFPAQQVVTKVLDVEFSLWRMWTITPVAKLDPVKLSWVTISNASLHNFDFISDKDIRLWDYVWIQRSWEVIPYVVWPVKEKRCWEEKEIFPPTNCPVCNSVLININDEVAYLCGNINCPWILKEKITYFVSKEWMEIDWFWDKFIDMFVDSWIVKHFSDIYKLNKPEIKILMLWLPLMWQKRVEELLFEIEKSKNNYIWKLLTALGIKHIGKKTAKLIEQSIFLDIKQKYPESRIKDVVNKFDYRKLIKYLTDREFMESIHGIWIKMIESAEKYMDLKENIKVLKELFELWVSFNKFEMFKTKDKSDLPMSWIHFAVTGKFNLPRPKIVQILESFWAIWDEQIRKGTDFLLVWADAWTKLSKSNQYWVKIISWFHGLSQEFWFLIDIFKEDGTIKTERKWPIQESLFW